MYFYKVLEKQLPLITAVLGKEVHLQQLAELQEGWFRITWENSPVTVYDRLPILV